MTRRLLPRLLAVLALAAAVAAILLVVQGSKTTKSTTDTTTTSQPSKHHGKKHKKAAATRPHGPRTYRVQAGDTLSSIARKTHVSIAVIQELNPKLDPQTLVVGQKIKLRS